MDFFCDTYVCQSYIKYSTTDSNEQYGNWSYIKEIRIVFNNVWLKYSIRT